MNKKVNIVSIDDGGSTTAIVTENIKALVKSVKGYDDGERYLSNVQGEGNYLIKYKGQSFIMGSIAERDCEMKMKMFTKSKQNVFFDISILVAIHQYGQISNNIIISNPIETYNAEEKEGRVKRLLGSHTITVNGVEKTFYIENVLVAPEGAVSYWIKQDNGVSRYLDIGSRTTNFATTVNENGENSFINTKSGTLFKGIETLKNYNPLALADFIGGHLSNIWESDDKIYVLGGGANDTTLISHLKGNYFSNIEVLPEPQFCNAMGMFNLAKMVYENY